MDNLCLKHRKQLYQKRLVFVFIDIYIARGNKYSRNHPLKIILSNTESDIKKSTAILRDKWVIFSNLFNCVNVDSNQVHMVDVVHALLMAIHEIQHIQGYKIVHEPAN